MTREEKINKMVEMMTEIMEQTYNNLSDKELDKEYEKTKRNYAFIKTMYKTLDDLEEGNSNGNN